MNSDWSDDWVFTDSRFDLLYGPHEAFLKFLSETVHPVVRPDSKQARAMVEEYNSVSVALAVATCLYFLSKSLLVSGVLSLVKRQPLRVIWQQCYLFAFPY